MHVIRMSHPAKNALSSDLMGWLEGQFDAAGAAPVLLTGSEGVFCAGLNLKEVASLDAAGMERFLRQIDRLAARIFDHPAPVVAALGGHAIAGGAVLAACCDWRVATSDPRTRIGVNEVALGVCYPPVILRILAHRFPSAQRERLMLGAELHAPAEALALGLVDQLADDPVAAAELRLKHLASHPSGTYAHTKALLRRGVTTLDAADERRFKGHELAVWLSAEVQARVAAVLKR